MKKIIIFLTLIFTSVFSLKNDYQAFANNKEDGFSISLPTYEHKTYKNVILFIGDGMGVTTVEATRIYNGGHLAMTDYFDFELLAYSRTDSITSTGFAYDESKNLIDPGVNEELYDGTPSPYGSDSLGTSGNITLYTDSAAGGTALATGQLTTNSRLAMDQFGNPITSILEQASGLGKKTGVLTSDTIDGATPAAFLSHVGARHDKSGILQSIATSPADLIIGQEPSEMKNNRSTYTSLYESKGFDVTFKADDLDINSSRIFSAIPGILPQGIFTPTLEDLTIFSLDYLDNDEGFFLMVEGANIDKQAHANQSILVIEETLGFDHAINAARHWVGDRKDTLIVITADHETGALSFLQDPSTLTKETVIENMKWLSTNHSRSLVRVDVSGDVREYLQKYEDELNYIYDKYYFDHILVNRMLRYYLS